MLQQGEREGFRQGTRQRMSQIGSMTVAIGAQEQVPLPPVGYGSCLLLTFNGTLTLSAPGVFHYPGPWGFIDRIRIDVNNGAANAFDTTGFGAYLVNQRMIKDAMFLGNNQLSFVSANAGANPIYFSLLLPIGFGDDVLFHMGLVNLQATDVIGNLNVTFANSGSNVVTNFTSLAGTITATYVSYEVPDLSHYLPPPPFMVRIVEDAPRPITATGEIEYVVPRGGTLLQLLQYVVLNDTVQTLKGQSTTGLDPNITYGKLVLNGMDINYSVPAVNQALWQAFCQRGSDPVGDCWDWNFMAAGETRVASGDLRDAYDAASISEIKTVLNIKQGATIGTVAHMHAIRRITQELR